MKFESMSWRTSDSTIKNFIKECLENLRRTAVHGISEGGFRYSGHAKMVKTALVGHQTNDDLTQGIFFRDLRIETGQELLPCGKMLAIAIAKTFFNHFVETISGDEFEKFAERCYCKTLSDLLRSN